MRFLADEGLQHKFLADRCISILGGNLCKDICDLRAPCVPLSDVEPLHIQRRLSQALQYSCRYWAHHVTQADELFHDLNSISNFLHEHLLHWLEVWCLLRKYPEAVDVLSDIEMFCVRASPCACKKLC